MNDLRSIFRDAGNVALTWLLLVYFLVACHKEPVGQVIPEDDSIPVEFRLSTPNTTRMTGVTDSNEATVDRWALFVFSPDGRLIGQPTVVESGEGTSAAEKSVVKTLSTGQYRIYAICNYPTSGDDVFDPSDITLSNLSDKTSALVSNKRNGLVMSGNLSMTLTANGGGTKHISVSRLAAKAEVTKVTVNMTEDRWKEETFVLKRMYLTNICTVSQYYSTQLFANDWVWARNMWYNTMGYHTSGSGYFSGSKAVTEPSAEMDSLTGDYSINAVISSNGGSYETAHTFYFYPNPVTAEQDNPSDTWGNKHRTRMVLECSLDGTTYYYAISLPPSTRNNSYIASDVLITRPGSTDPEVDTPGAVTVTWKTFMDDWDGPFIVTENS